MNTDELYQEVILDHASRPRNCRAMEGATATVEAQNPMCGDELTLFLKMGSGGEMVEATAFQSQACAICTASASLLTTKIKNLAAQDAAALSARFQQMLTAAEVPPDCELEALGGLRALGGVRQFPARIKCATLAWHALDQALHDAREGIKANLLIEEDTEP